MSDMKAILLELISPKDSITASQLAVLTDAHWQQLIHMAREHRIAPLLYWRLKEKKLQLPAVLWQTLKEYYQRAVIRGLTMQAELLKLHQLLEQAGIAHIALKGSYLSYFVYPNPALRPMRDIDLLIPDEQLMAAYQLLLAQGYVHPPKYQGDVQSAQAMLKHLMPLQSPSQVVVELHNKVLNPDDWPGEDLTTDPHFWARCRDVDMAGRTIHFMSATDLLLHLIIHASYDHKFNNGPLILSDIAFLIQKEPIDWALFWQKAEEGGGCDGCSLVLYMLKLYDERVDIQGLQTVGRGGQALAQDAKYFYELTLQDYHARGDQILLSNLMRDGWWHKIWILTRKIFPSKTNISLQFPVSRHSPFVYCYYPLRWLYILQRLPAVFKSNQQQELNHQAKKLAVLLQWFDEKE
ncbi:nucleotidyltransferase domain-containing protein [Celerinatantimonas yamalensis]|uniref:Nucleotidyltransferase family protein n=1 Tax=Celerinatantimonas yamalensis TaxID=559956 RepID=A0ABW9G5P8_9GAMM